MPIRGESGAEHPSEGAERLAGILDTGLSVESALEAEGATAPRLPPMREEMTA